MNQDRNQIKQKKQETPAGKSSGSADNNRNIDSISLEVDVKGKSRWIKVRPLGGTLSKDRMRGDGFRARTVIGKGKERTPVTIEGTPVSGTVARYLDDNDIAGGFSFAVWKDDGRRLNSAIIRNIRY